MPFFISITLCFLSVNSFAKESQISSVKKVVLHHQVQHQVPIDHKNITKKHRKTKNDLSKKSKLQQPISLQKQMKQLKTVAEDITTTKTSPLQKKIEVQRKASSNPFAILLFHPNYVMPFYYTAMPDYKIYKGITPDNQKIKKQEFKAQISFQFPLFRGIFHKRLDLFASYTQLFFWQFYSKSQFFRETNYEPAVFLRHNFLKNWVLDFGVVHESNGRGGKLERSWNRLFMNLGFSGQRWYVSLKPWILIFKQKSSDLHNKHIARYLGYGRFLFAYKFHKAVFSIKLRNIIASAFKHKAEQLTFSYPIKGRIRFYVQVFNGYGQSLIEYNHKTVAAGVGIELNEWI